ncbi:hypothetical protein DAETH_28720 [Deinococcus aetherius]|uniref:Uncharacterized protein n=1 Tax=Deinococcus aetherius TaxID=200252 RepID=A0ABM8AGH1_9DEIO|nr:hypothetical protein [Deinococcus aetherius]BDP42903.1 hypothetical protein DAETH_28720 [Deinococcus aetherius]
MSGLPRAADMRVQLEQGATAKAQAQLAKLAEEIRAATARGAASVNLYDSLEPGVEAHLKAAGYSIRHTHVGHDPREPYGSDGYYTVSW